MRNIMNKNFFKKENNLGLLLDKGYKGFHWHCPSKHLSLIMIEKKN